MKTNELLTIVISVLSLIVAVVSVTISVDAQSKTKFLAETNNRLMMAQVELDISNMINARKERLSDIVVFLTPIAEKKNSEGLNAEELRTFDALSQQYATAKENYINGYEDACAAYLDGKVDTVRFKKTYHVELRNVVKDFKSFFDSHSSPYKAIITVYEEWENLEK